MRLSALRWRATPPTLIGRDELAEAGAAAIPHLAALNRDIDAGFFSPLQIDAGAPADAALAPGTAQAMPEDEMPTHDPPLAPRDLAAFLLHIAAEIEHALMVQYLYAAYSLNPKAAGLSANQSTQVANWKRTILAIAKEEMGHFISVQNILISLGAPLNFEREDYPFRSRFYPFEFKLEPLTIQRRKSLAAAMKASKGNREKMERALFSASLNRYVAAEMPALDLIPAADKALVDALTQGVQVNRVGLLFKRLLDLFDAGPMDGLVDGDFDGERVDAQARASEWGSKDEFTTSFHPLVRPVKTRAEARALLAEIAEQGEGHQEGAATSHFQRFLTIFKELEQFDPEQVYLHPIATNPTTAEGASEATVIANPRTCRWAQLLNLRYRLLLGYLRHFLSVGGDLFTAAGDRTPHGWLVIATFMEMSNIKAISELLVGLDLAAPGGVKAGPTFELPYSLALPEREKDRWRSHIAVLTATRGLALALETSLAPGAESEAAILTALAGLDRAALADLQELRKGNPPVAATGFAKVRQILDEGLRGFPLARVGHDEFWRVDDETKIPSVAGHIPLKPGDGVNSDLVKALKGEAPFGSDLGTPGAFLRRMPAGRAPIDPARINFIEKWIDGLAPAPGPPHNGSTPMGRYQEIIDILDAAVGGSAAPVGAHGAFWRNQTKDEFAANSVFGQKLLVLGDGAGSNLIKALSGQAPFGADIGTPGASFRRMPAGRPAVDPDKIGIIKKWIDDGGPE